MSIRPIILFSAMSIDGYIAKPDGGLDWLFEFDATTTGKSEAETIFKAFYDTIDTTIMGRKTYAQICQEGQPNPYPEKENYVISRSAHETSAGVKYITNNLEDFILDQKNRPGKPIWLVGGGELNAYFLLNNLIDSIILDIIPVILGNGIKLFEGSSSRLHTNMRFETVNTYHSGRLHVRYSRK